MERAFGVSCRWFLLFEMVSSVDRCARSMIAGMVDDAQEVQAFVRGELLELLFRQLTALSVRLFQSLNHSFVVTNLFTVCVENFVSAGGIQSHQVENPLSFWWVGGSPQEFRIDFETDWIIRNVPTWFWER